MLKKAAFVAIAAVHLVSACAGRTPDPVPVARPLTDVHMSCFDIQSEITNNTSRISELSKEKGQKVAQNVAAGTVGVIVFFPALFLMDFQGAAKKEIKALEDRNTYLASRAVNQCKLA